MAKFDRCYKCHVIQPVKALDGGLCWQCAGLRKPPAILRATLTEPEPVNLDPDAKPCNMKTAEEMQAEIVDNLPPSTDEAQQAETEA